MIESINFIAMAKYDNEKLYIVIDEEVREIFEDEVSKRLQNGYLPIGGVSNYIDELKSLHYCQALLKPAEDND